MSRSRLCRLFQTLFHAHIELVLTLGLSTAYYSHRARSDARFERCLSLLSYTSYRSFQALNASHFTHLLALIQALLDLHIEYALTLVLSVLNIISSSYCRSFRALSDAPIELPDICTPRYLTVPMSGLCTVLSAHTYLRCAIRTRIKLMICGVPDASTYVCCAICTHVSALCYSHTHRIYDMWRA